MSNSGQWAVATPKARHTKLASNQKQRRPMKRTIKQRFAQWLLRDDSEFESDSISISRVEHGDFDMDEPVRFDLVSAQGGRILQVRRWDRKRDNHDITTYVIPSGEDVGQRVAKIVNLELIK